MKRIAIIGSVGIPPRYGGFETLTENLFKQLKGLYQFVISYDQKKYSKFELPNDEHLELVPIPISANGPSSILHDIIALLKVYKKSDAILLLGISAGFLLPIIKKLLPLPPIIVHIDGIEWHRKKWNRFAKGLLYWSYKSICKNSDALIADNQAIYNKVYSTSHQPVFLIAYGGDEPKNDEKIAQALHLPASYFLTIARAVPENSLEIIAESFRKCPLKNWLLISNFHQSAYGHDFKLRYSSCPNIFLVDAVYNIQHLDVYRANCLAYVHGHTAGGTNPSLVEALWCKKPVICHNNVFNRNTSFNLASYFSSIDELVEILSGELYIHQPIEQIHRLVRTAYSWITISNKYRQMFDDLFRSKR